MSARPSVLELFSGCGGAALGLSRAGWRHLACVEWAPAAASTLMAAGLPAVQGDVREVDYSPFVDRTDLLWASPPCQAGSTAGKRQGAEDSRNGWPWTLEVVDRVKPTWLLCENVRGWTFHKRGCSGKGRGLSCIGCYWENWLLPRLRERFAFVGWWLMNAADYGTPQFRRRVILWAGPLPLARDPPATSHHDPEEPGFAELGRHPWVTVREAIGDTLNRQSCERRACYPCDEAHGRACQETWRLDRPSPTVVTVEEKGTRASATTGWTFNGGPDRASDMAFLTAGIRRIDIEEGLRLQGFPADWPLQGTRHERYLQVGNAVPPQMSRAAGAAVLKAHRVWQGLVGVSPQALAAALERSGVGLTVPTHR
jgi:DNA (cytosine-5)-methyltransferase 1